MYPQHMFLWRNKKKCKYVLVENGTLSGTMISRSARSKKMVLMPYMYSKGGASVQSDKSFLPSV